MYKLLLLDFSFRPKSLSNTFFITISQQMLPQSSCVKSIIVPRFWKVFRKNPYTMARFEQGAYIPKAAAVTTAPHRQVVKIKNS
jgi:hypothetical protein